MTEAMLAAGNLPHQLVAGVLVDAAEDAAEQARHALQRGARNILLAPPSYFKNVGEDGLFGWFSAVFAALGPLAATCCSTTSLRLPWCSFRLALSAGCALLFPTWSPGSRIPAETGATARRCLPPMAIW